MSDRNYRTRLAQAVAPESDYVYDYNTNAPVEVPIPGTENGPEASDTPSLDLVMAGSLGDLLEDVVRSTNLRTVCHICHDPKCTFFHTAESYREGK